MTKIVTRRGYDEKIDNLSFFNMDTLVAELNKIPGCTFEYQDNCRLIITHSGVYIDTMFGCEKDGKIKFLINGTREYCSGSVKEAVDYVKFTLQKNKDFLIFSAIKKIEDKVAEQDKKLDALKEMIMQIRDSIRK